MRIPSMLFAAALALSTPTVAFAAEVGGVKLDDKISLGGQELVLNGAGIRTRAIFKVYVASLYLPQKAKDLQGVLAQSPRRVQMNMLRTLSSDQLVEALNDGLAGANSAAEIAAIKPQVDQLLAIMKAFKEIKEKDVVALDFVDGATKVSWNAETKGSVPGDALNRALTKIWVGDSPVQGDLRKAMLGG
jgi:Chalcone isomerase-like